MDLPPDLDTGDATPYECFDCATIVDDGDGHPGVCPNCGGTMRNRGLPIE
ncbi:rubrerythrin-like domain-containing protein [Halorubrum sp. DTA98]